jgi:hypothetical protein
LELPLSAVKRLRPQLPSSKQLCVLAWYLERQLFVIDPKLLLLLLLLLSPYTLAEDVLQKSKNPIMTLLQTT